MPISKEMMIAAAKAYHSVAFGLHPHALRAALESVLSAAEPVAWLVKRYDLKGVLLDTELSFVRPTIKSTCRTDMVPLYGAPPAPSVAMESLELDGVPDALAYGKGMWRTCTGCHESDEGYPTGPFSDTLKCHLGGGCFECGGIGAVWDTTDYEDMGNFIALSAQVQHVAGLERLRDVTFAVQHNPNCPAKYLVRLVGKSGRIDLKPYGNHLPRVKHETGDVLGFGKTLDEAIDNAIAAAAHAKQEGGADGH